MRGLALANYVLALPGAAAALMIHEYFKASVSYRLGDPYPKLNGRLRFSPVSQLEPIGFLLMLLYGYGWGKPVNTSDTYYKDRRMGTIITYIIPSLINLLFAFVFFIILTAAKQFSYTTGYSLPLSSQGFAQGIQAVGASGYGVSGIFSAQSALLFISGTVYQIMYIFTRCSLSVAFVNLIPIYPLDASALLDYCLPPEFRYTFGQYKGILVMILILLFMTGVINAIFDPAVTFFLRSVQ